MRDINLGSSFTPSFPVTARETKKRLSEEQRIAKAESYREKYGNSMIRRRSQIETPVVDLKAKSKKSESIRKRSKSSGVAKSRSRSTARPVNKKKSNTSKEATGISDSDVGDNGIQQDPAELPIQEQAVSVYVATAIDTIKMEIEGVSFKTLLEKRDQLAYDIGSFVLSNLVLQDSSGQSKYKLFGFQYYEDLGNIHIDGAPEPAHSHYDENINEEVTQNSESFDEQGNNSFEGER